MHAVHVAFKHTAYTGKTHSLYFIMLPHKRGVAQSGTKSLSFSLAIFSLSRSHTHLITIAPSKTCAPSFALRDKRLGRNSVTHRCAALQTLGEKCRIYVY